MRGAEKMTKSLKAFRSMLQDQNGWARAMKPGASRQWAALVVGPPLLGLCLFLVLDFRLAVFLYALFTGLAYVMAKVIEARGRISLDGSVALVWRCGDVDDETG